MPHHHNDEHCYKRHIYIDHVHIMISAANHHDDHQPHSPSSYIIYRYIYMYMYIISECSEPDICSISLYAFVIALYGYRSVSLSMNHCMNTLAPYIYIYISLLSLNTSNPPSLFAFPSHIHHI